MKSTFSEYSIPETEAIGLQASYYIVSLAELGLEWWINLDEFNCWQIMEAHRTANRFYRSVDEWVQQHRLERQLYPLRCIACEQPAQLQCDGCQEALCTSCATVHVRTEEQETVKEWERQAEDDRVWHGGEADEA